MPVRRFDARSWVASPFASRRLDLSQFAKERAAVAEICSRVLTDGDLALSELGRRFDGWAPPEGESFEVPPDDFAAAIGRVASADRAALEFAAARIRQFHKRQVAQARCGWQWRNTSSTFQRNTRRPPLVCSFTSCCINPCG